MPDPLFREVPKAIDHLEIAEVGEDAFPGIFIRAPVIERVGPDVQVLAAYGDLPVLGRQGAVLFATFHPELARDLRVHQLFLNEVR